MTREQIEKLPVIIAIMLSGSVTVDVKENIHKQLTEVCNLAIKALEQEPKWIPVSERMPEKTGMYLISMGDLVTSKSFDGHNFRTESAVRFIPDAWMPLPEPFEPQESEESIINGKKT